MFCTEMRIKSSCSGKGRNFVVGCVALERYCSLRRLAFDGTHTGMNYSHDIKRFSVKFQLLLLGMNIFLPHDIT